MFDPRTKLLLTLAGAVLIVSTRQLPWLIAEWVLMAIGVVALRRAREYLKWLRTLAPMALFFGGVTVWSADLSAGLSAGMGLLAITSLFFIFFATTDPEDLGNSLVHAGLPFSAAFVATAALQFVPLVGRKARAVIETQQARGIVLKPGLQALRNYPALLVPLLVQCFQMADNLAEAMETRGFGCPGRSFRTACRMRWPDFLAIGGAWGGVAALLCFAPLA